MAFVAVLLPQRIGALPILRTLNFDLDQIQLSLSALTFFLVDPFPLYHPPLGY